MRTKDILAQEQKEFITKLLALLKTDPSADDFILGYESTEEYLWELLEKDGSVLDGLVAAMETYLDK